MEIKQIPEDKTRKERARALLDEFQDNGDERVLNKFFDCIYHDLLSIARRKLDTFKDKADLAEEDVVHNFYIRQMSRSNHGYTSLEHFIARATLLMRHQLIDYMRSKGRKIKEISIDDQQEQIEILLGKDESLSNEQNIIVLKVFDELARINQQLATIAWMRYSGFNFEEIAAVMSLSLDQVKRRWKHAKQYLESLLKDR